MVVNSSMEPQLKSTRLIDGEVKVIMDNYTEVSEWSILCMLTHALESNGVKTIRGRF